MNPNRTDIPREIPLNKPSLYMAYTPKELLRKSAKNCNKKSGKSSISQKSKYVETKEVKMRLNNLESQVDNLEMEMNNLIDSFYASITLWEMQKDRIHRVLKLAKSNQAK